MDAHRHHRRAGPFGRREAAHVHMHEKKDIKTEVEVVYVTATGPASGKVVGFTTLDESETTTPLTTAKAKTTAPTTTPTVNTKTTPKTTPTPTPTPTPTQTPAETTKPTPATTQSKASETANVLDVTTVSSSDIETSQTTFSTRVSTAIDASGASSSSTSSFLTDSATIASQTSNATPSATAAAASGGMTTTATVGVVAGACAVLLVLCAFAAFFYRRKAQKKMAAAYGKTEDEKSSRGHGIGFDEKPDDYPSSMSEKAPRVSLRPVTQFSPNLMMGTGAVAAGAGATTQVMTSTTTTGLSAAPSDTRKAPPPALNLVTEPAAAPAPAPMTPVSPLVPVVAPAMASPTGSTFSDAPSTATVGAAGTQNPVHRVQMDFKPSMADELELRAGALVRLLHEYDDGWALCTRLDRSQQGVCPRTCLSQRPVKPRPGPPPPGSPPQGRPNPNATGRQSPVIRPYSPGPGRRPQSPASPSVGYVKAQYRPASPQAVVQSRPSTPVNQSVPQSPVTKTPPPASLRVGPPQITVSAAPETTESVQSPATFAPAKPSPLSTVEKVEDKPIAAVVKKEVDEVECHAM